MLGPPLRLLPLPHHAGTLLRHAVLSARWAGDEGDQPLYISICRAIVMRVVLVCATHRRLMPLPIHEGILPRHAVLSAGWAGDEGDQPPYLSLCHAIAMPAVLVCATHRPGGQGGPKNVSPDTLTLVVTLASRTITPHTVSMNARRPEHLSAERMSAPLGRVAPRLCQGDMSDVSPSSSGQGDTRDTLPRSSGQRDTPPAAPRSPRPYPPPIPFRPFIPFASPHLPAPRSPRPTFFSFSFFILCSTAPAPPP